MEKIECHMMLFLKKERIALGEDSASQDLDSLPFQQLCEEELCYKKFNMIPIHFLIHLAMNRVNMLLLAF